MTSSPSSNVHIIAEAGVNHNGSLEMALALVDAAKDAGADAVKFQTFRATSLATPQADKASYQKVTTDRSESQLEMLARLELTPAMHDELIAHAMYRGIDFLSAPFDEPSLELLSTHLALRTIKIPSGEITNGPLLLAVARSSAEQVILSTGMSNLSEVEEALGVLAFGFTAGTAVRPSRAAFERAYSSYAGQLELKRRVSILHCTSEYPAPVADVNLRAMTTLYSAFGLRTGYSDHTEGSHIAVAAVALGARLIEKHLTLDRKLPGPDHRASLEPEAMTQMVLQIREVEKALGNSVKFAAPSEIGTREVARKSLVATRPIVTGEVLNPDNVGCKRPGIGISPMQYWERLGTASDRNYGVDERIA